MQMSYSGLSKNDETIKKDPNAMQNKWKLFPTNARVVKNVLRMQML